MTCIPIGNEDRPVQHRRRRSARLARLGACDSRLRHLDAASALKAGKRR